MALEWFLSKEFLIGLLKGFLIKLLVKLITGLLKLLPSSKLKAVLENTRNDLLERLKGKGRKIGWRETEKSIDVHLGDDLERGMRKNAIVKVIDKTDAYIDVPLQRNTNLPLYHYERHGFHFGRRLNCLPLLRGDEDFFLELSEKLAEQFERANIDVVLTIGKEANRMFAGKVAENLPKRVKLRYLKFDRKEQMVSPYRDKPEVGSNILLVETVLLPGIDLKPVIECIKEYRCTLVGIGVLFDGSRGLIDFSAYGLGGIQIVSAALINLEVAPKNGCLRLLGNHDEKKLKYKDY